MTFRSATRVIVVLAATAALAQSAQPGTTPGAPILNRSAAIQNRQSLAGRRGPVGNTTADPQSPAAMRERVQDMESTLSQMRVVLKQMHAKTAKSKATDSLTKANLDMWELMVGQLDKELQQLRETLAAREDLEARRAALYKQADAKAAAATQAARAAQAARFAEAEKNATGTPTPAPAAQSAEQSPGTQTAPAQPSAAPPTNNSASPN
jgi:peptidoglycan hydrolase CwlO-like protein